MKKKFRSFVEARKFVYSLGLKSRNEWNEYCKLEKKPNDIPQSPERTYKNKGWNGVGDWLGTGTIAPHKRKYWKFQKARALVRSLKFNDGNDWSEYSKSGKKPNFLPFHPERIYKNEWKGLGDWLGTERIANKDIQFLTFEEAKNFVHSLRIKSQKEWNKYCKSGKKPDYIPHSAPRTYKNKGWKNWGDWFGTGSVATYNRQYKLFDEAKQFVHSLGFLNRKQWRKYFTSKKNPKDIPLHPEVVYKKEWIGWGDWFGSGFIATFNRKYLPFNEAKLVYQKLAKENGLKNTTDWRHFIKSHKLPKDIPANPWQVYTKEKVFKRMIVN